MSDNFGWLDRFGNSVELGDTVVYSVRGSTCVWLYKAVVEEINEWNVKVRVIEGDHWGPPNGRIATLTNPTWVVLAKAPVNN